MAGPIVFISHRRVEPSRFEAFVACLVDGSKVIEAAWLAVKWVDAEIEAPRWAWREGPADAGARRRVPADHRRTLSP